MFAKLDRLREDRKRLQQRLKEAQDKVDEIEVRIKEAEATEILNIVAEMHWTPEQLAEFIRQKKEPTAGNGFIRKVEEKREDNTNEKA